MSLTTLKWAAILCFMVAMVILLGDGVAMRKDLPPYPGKVVGPDGNPLFEKKVLLFFWGLFAYFPISLSSVWGFCHGPGFSLQPTHT